MYVEERNEIDRPVEWERSEKLLYRAGVNRSYRGFVMSLDAVFLLRQETCMKAVFIETAKRNQTAKGNVERDIGTLIRAIWNYGDREALEEIAGKKLKKPPTCQEFIRMLADCVKKREGPA